ncbi:MAG: hypothetical protein AAB935_00555 [Patescibacteria group bacterium]
MSKENEILLEEKWRKFLGYRWLFYFVPFLDFVLVAGSLVFGKVHENSDFDVIVGAKSGRIFTARFFCYLIFGAARARRSKLDHKETARDKICFSHFVTSASYGLRPPYNVYWEKLYRCLAPVYGNLHSVELFFAKNRNWCGREEILLDRNVWRETKFNFFRHSAEFILGGSFGDFIERFLKKIQISRIRETLKNYGSGFAPRLRFGDDELEFHPDTARIEIMIKEISTGEPLTWEQ